MPAPAVHMDEYRSLISFFIFPAQAVYLGATLIQTAYLAEGDRTTHTSFPFAVIQVFIVSNTVFGILDDNVYFGSFHHQVACQAKHDIVGIFIFMQFDFANPSDCSWIRTSMSADQVETSAFQFG